MTHPDNCKRLKELGEAAWRTGPGGRGSRDILAAGWAIGRGQGLMLGCNQTYESAVQAGAGEYYIDANNQRAFRWTPKGG